LLRHYLTITSDIAPASFTIRLNSQRGTLPVWRGRSVMPVRDTLSLTTAQGINVSRGQAVNDAFFQRSSQCLGGSRRRTARSGPWSAPRQAKVISQRQK